MFSCTRVTLQEAFNIANYLYYKYGLVLSGPASLYLNGKVDLSRDKYNRDEDLLIFTRVVERREITSGEGGWPRETRSMQRLQHFGCTYPEKDWVEVTLEVLPVAKLKLILEERRVPEPVKLILVRHSPGFFGTFVKNTRVPQKPVTQKGCLQALEKGGVPATNVEDNIVEVAHREWATDLKILKLVKHRYINRFLMEAKGLFDE